MDWRTRSRRQEPSSTKQPNDPIKPNQTQRTASKARSRARNCSSVRIMCSWAALASSVLSRLRKVSRSWRSQTLRTPVGETISPRLVSSLATRTWPNAGFSKATSTTAFSMCSSTAAIGWPPPEGLNEPKVEAKLFVNQPVVAKAVPERFHLADSRPANRRSSIFMASMK